MLAEKTNELTPSPAYRRWLPWLNLLLAVALVGLGVWYLADKVSLADVASAIRLANPAFIAAAILVMIVTVVLKGWRWQLLLTTPDEQPAFPPVFWALMLGQYVNLIVPFLRLGEVARIYALNRQTDVAMARSLGTLVVEKVLDLIMLGLTVALILPFVILPEFVGQPGPLLWSVPVAALLVLYLLAYQSRWIARLVEAVGARLPWGFAKRLVQWSISGLEGLAALRSRRLSLLLVASSAVIAFLSVLLPWILFAAFHLELGLLQAALIHVAITLATTPPSTPGKIGVFNGVAAFMLYSFGVADDAAVVSYAIVFHLVVIVPQIALGAVAASRTQWRWRRGVSGDLVAQGLENR